MGALYESFGRELDACARRYSGSPKDEMVALCLLALEREELVAVGYRENVLVPRLASLRVDDSVREIIRHALLWTWKDEEMHTIYIRGAILKLANWPLRFAAFSRQLAGAVAGWSASVRQHVSWSAAPIARALATGSAGVGALIGRIPRGVCRHLKYGPLRNFCTFNVDAERTAWLCWKRMAELAERVSGLPANTAADFRRVQTDEERHAKIFQILADALNENDELVEGESEETLCEKIGEVGEFFLPRGMRKHFVTRNPLGSGGKVFLREGKALDQKIPLFKQIVRESGLVERLRERARELGKRTDEVTVAIKPAFMMGYDRRDTSMITDPVLLDVLAVTLKEAGCTDVAVVESRNIYDQFFGARTVSEVARYFGYDSPNYRVVDGSEDQVHYSYMRGLAQYSVARTWKEADFRITFGKMRSHPVELAYLTVGNVEWMGGRCDQFIFVERQAQRETAIMMLLDEFPPHFSILEGYESAADGLVGVMGCPRPKSPLRYYAGADALAVDIVAARHMGVRDPRKSSLLRAACHWFGNPSGSIDVVGADTPLPDWCDPYHNEISTMLSLMAFPVYVMGSGRGSLFLPEMDQSAFPFIEPETTLQRFSRRMVRHLIGLNHAK